MDAETTDLLRSSIRELFDTYDGDIATRLDEFGFSEVVDEDPVVAVDLLFSEQGAAGKPSSALDALAFGAPSTGARARRVVHPIAADEAASRSGAQLYVDGVLLGPADGSAVVGVDGAAVELPADVVSAATPVGGFDPASGLYRLRTGIDVAATNPVDGDWTAATASAHRALASELVGNGTAMLRIAGDQITERNQFGRPIGANQSPRHRLAESYALLGGAAELVQAAWRSGTPWDARVAKTYAGYAAHATSRACLQVCGAIGLTTEHRLPVYVKRGRVLDALYGGWHQSIDALGARLLADTQIPTAARI